MKRIVPFLFLLTVPSLTQVGPASPKGFKITEDVDLVVLSASVTDRKGRCVSGLRKENFEVFENGERQHIKVFSSEDMPVTVGLLVDNSSSMRGKRAEVTMAALAFVRSSNPEDEVFVINFNEYVSFGLSPDVPFTSNLGLLRAALTDTPATGKTALCDAIAGGLEHLENGARDKKALLVISDGGDNASRRDCADVLAAARRSNALIYCIGVYHEADHDRNPRFLKRLARETGGASFFPYSIEEVGPACRRIADDLRNQYTIGYVPSNQSDDGTYRRIHVRVKAAGLSGLRVRTREGYMAPARPSESGAR